MIEFSAHYRLWQSWGRFCECWAARWERAYPGCDAHGMANHAFWKALVRYDPRRGSFGNFLRANMRNTIASTRRTAANRERNLPRVPLEEPLWIDRDDRAEDGEASIVDMLELLPPNQRHAVEEVVLRDRPYAELAREIGVNPTTVQKRVKLGLKRIRTHLAREQKAFR